MAAAVSLFAAETPYLASIGPKNSFDGIITYQGQTVLDWSVAGWGAKWSSFGTAQSKDRAAGKGQPLKTSSVIKLKNDSVNIALESSIPSDRTLSLDYVLKAEKDIPVTLIAWVINVPADAAGTKVTLTEAGKPSEYAFPFAKTLDAKAVSKAVFHLASGDVTATFEPPLSVGGDNALRVKLADGVCKAGATHEKITLTFPQPYTYAASEGDLSQFVNELGANWFPWTPNDFSSPSIIGMENWLDKPAGKHGGVRMVGNHFELEDGTRIKFWGTNLCNNACAPSKPDAKAVATRFAKHGVNAVRFHKFTNRGGEGIGDPKDATKFTPAGLDQLDNLTSELSSRGIYYGFSHTFGMKVCEGNRGRLLAYDEILKSAEGGNTYALINFAEDVQDIMIERVVNLLKHKNPYTNKTYAEDSALAWIELQNEDDIFFASIKGAFAKCPTYAKKFSEQFNEWLLARYGTQDKLAAAWKDALTAKESLQSKNVILNINPWFMSDDNVSKKTSNGTQVLPGVVPKDQDAAVRRLMDTALFLHETQNKFYSKFVNAIRQAGYKGPIEGSPWQAASGVPHYYNLRSDYLAGFIDRHNYGNNKFDGTDLKTGLGFFSSGLQQVIDRPFGISEWTGCFPGHYQAEDPDMVAIYGLGLQGWSSSYQFTSWAKGEFNPIVGAMPFRVWQTDTPANMGQYPALARMIYRGDVKEADIISTRKVSLEELEKGQLSFSDKVVQNGDVKSFTGAVPPEALLVGRCVIQFTDKPEPSALPELAQYQNGPLTTSSTGQLVWDASNPERCSFTVNTEGTKAIVGFADGKSATLGNVTLTSHGPYISLLLTALEKTETLDNSKSALISIISRNTNAGLTISTVDNQILDVGKGGIVLEPVKADVAIKGRLVKSVNVLDVNGKRTTSTVPVSADGVIHLDTGRDKTMYYELVFK